VWARLYPNQRGATIALEWECRQCERRWPVMDRDLIRPSDASSSDPEGASPLLGEISSLRETNDDLRASTLRWRQLYENAIRRVAEREDN